MDSSQWGARSLMDHSTSMLWCSAPPSMCTAVCVLSNINTVKMMAIQDGLPPRFFPSIPFQAMIFHLALSSSIIAGSLSSPFALLFYLSSAVKIYMDHSLYFPSSPILASWLKRGSDTHLLKPGWGRCVLNGDTVEKGGKGPHILCECRCLLASRLGCKPIDGWYCDKLVLHTSFFI